MRAQFGRTIFILCCCGKAVKGSDMGGIGNLIAGAVGGVGQRRTDGGFGQARQFGRAARGALYPAQQLPGRRIRFLTSEV